MDFWIHEGLLDLRSKDLKVTLEGVGRSEALIIVLAHKGKYDNNPDIFTCSAHGELRNIYQHD